MDIATIDIIQRKEINLYFASTCSQYEAQSTEFVKATFKNLIFVVNYASSSSIYHLK